MSLSKNSRHLDDAIKNFLEPEIAHESRGVEGLGRVIGVFYHLLWIHQQS